MRRRFFIALAAAVTVISAISCAKDDTLRYNNVTMGNVIDGTYITDQGNRFNIVEQTCTGNITDYKRVFTICDVLKSGGAENEYDVRLNLMLEVLEKDARERSSIENIETYMNDPLRVGNAWISGGYINFIISAPFDRSKIKDGEVADEDKHEINLLYEKEGNVYKFNIRQDAKGDVLKIGEENLNLEWRNAYVSFPVTSIITEENAKISIEWNNYVISEITGEINGAAAPEIISGDYQKSSYEHQPPAVAPGVATMNIL